MNTKNPIHIEVKEGGLKFSKTIPNRSDLQDFILSRLASEYNILNRWKVNIDYFF